MQYGVLNIPANQSFIEVQLPISYNRGLYGCVATHLSGATQALPTGVVAIKVNSVNSISLLGIQNTIEMLTSYITTGGSA